MGRLLRYWPVTHSHLLNHDPLTYCLLCLATVRVKLETSNLACRLTGRGINGKNECKIWSKGVVNWNGTSDLLFKFWNFVTDSISREWLKLKTSFLIHRCKVSVGLRWPVKATNAILFLWYRCSAVSLAGDTICGPEIHVAVGQR